MVDWSAVRRGGDRLDPAGSGERALVFVGFLMFLGSCFFWSVFLKGLSSYPKLTIVMVGAFLLMLTLSSLSVCSLVVMRFYAGRSLRFYDGGWRFSAHRIVHLVSILQLGIIVALVPILVLVVLRWLFFGESFSFKWFLICLSFVVILALRQHPISSWRVFEPPSVRVDAEGIVIRSLYGGELKCSWSEAPVVRGLASKGIRIDRSGTGPGRISFAAIEAGAMLPAQLEKLIAHFVAHPEDRSLLGTERARPLLVSLMKVPW